MFMGIIRIGETVTATLTVAGDAAGTAALFLGHASAEGATSDAAMVAPGGTGHASVEADAKGIVRVVVDFTAEEDAGQLEVGPPTPAEEIQGDTTWVYAVV